MHASGLFLLSTDVARNVNLFSRNNDPNVYECSAYRCPVINVPDANGHAHYWATEENVKRHCVPHTGTLGDA
jgi:hypothetical protein